MLTSDMSELVDEVTRLYDGLDDLDYYTYLGIRTGCDYIAVREAYHARAQRFHPDRFVGLEGPSLRQAVYGVYKRMTEAYNVLADPSLRQAYDQARERGHARLPPEERTPRLSAEERKVKHPFARIYLRSARAKLDRGDVEGARIDAELGLSLEPGSPLRILRERIEDAARTRPGKRS